MEGGDMPEMTIPQSRGPGTSLALQKPTVVRVKRKRDDPPLETVWLEVTGRPIKRRELNLEDLSLDDRATETSDKGASNKFLFRRVETLSLSGAQDILLPKLLSELKERKRSCEKQEPRQTRSSKLSQDRQGQVLAAAKEQHEASSRTARFEQVWRSRRREGSVTEEDDAIRELFHLYDVVRVDVEVESAAKAERRKQAQRDAQLVEGQLLCNYLPMLREVLPALASEIDAAAKSLPTTTASTTSEEYVYDVYALDEEMEDSKEGEASHPVIQIMDDETYDWREMKPDPDYDSEDSNDENHPGNDYPEDEDEFVADGLHRDSNSDFSDYDVNPYSLDNEEYDTVLSDEEGMQRHHK